MSPASPVDLCREAIRDTPSVKQAGRSAVRSAEVSQDAEASGRKQRSARPNRATHAPNNKHAGFSQGSRIPRYQPRARFSPQVTVDCNWLVWFPSLSGVISGSTECTRTHTHVLTHARTHTRAEVRVSLEWQPCNAACGCIF